MPARPSGAGRRKLTILLCLRPADGQPGVLNATGMTGPGNHPSQRSGTEVGTERGEETQELTVGSAGLALWGTFQAPSSPRLWPPSSTCRADTSPVVPGARWGPCRWVSQIGMFKVAQHPATVLRRELSTLSGPMLLPRSPAVSDVRRLGNEQQDLGSAARGFPLRATHKQNLEHHRGEQRMRF